MIKNYVLIAWRNLLKNKVISSINIIGLLIGLLASLLIFMYVSYERSYDKCYPDADRIYRLINIRNYSSHIDESAGCVVQLGPALKETFPEVEQYARCFITSGILSYEQKLFKEEQVLYADSTFFDIFKLPFVSKINSLPLARNNTAVLTKKMATKYFGTENPLGKTLMLDGRVPFVVEGIIENVPANSHIQYDIVLSLITLLSRENYCFGCNNRATYVRLAPNANNTQLESKFPEIIKKIHHDEGFTRSYKLQPLTDIHLHSNLRFELSQNGSIRQIRILTVVALLVLLISWINYINLTTSLILNRLKEIGLRKVFGAMKLKLAGQFMIESSFLFLIVLVIDSTILQILAPSISRKFGIDVYQFFGKNLTFLGNVLSVYFIVALFTGLITAYSIASVNIIAAFRKKITIKNINLPGRNIFVVGQFVIAIVLMGASLVIFRQNSYMINHDPGLDLKQVIVFPSPALLKTGADYRTTLNSFMDELSLNTGIKEVSFCSTIPGNENSDVGGGYSRDGVEAIQLFRYDVALNFFSFFKIPLICGRLPYRYDISDCVPECNPGTELLINRSAISIFGFNGPENALGKPLYNEGKICGIVVGVVEDFNQQSLKFKPSPAYFRCFERKNFIVMRISGENLQITRKTINKTFTSFFPETPNESFFLEDHFNLQYKDDKSFATLFALFSILAIVITCMGLLGMVLLDAKKRTKEIGIRKVNGAKTGSIIILLLKKQIIIILLAAFMAIPLTYWLMIEWLSRFAYKIEIGIGNAVYAVFIAVFITLFTTVGYIIRAARANPVESLKYE
jgi:putative ABC transport system permease protein